MVFLDENFNYEPYLCNGCHNIIQKAMNFNIVAIVSIKGNYYRIHFWYMSKDDAINIMKNSDFIKMEVLREKLKDKYRELSEEEKKYKERIWKKQIS